MAGRWFRDHLPLAELGQADDRGAVQPLDLGLVAGRLRHLAAQVDHGGGRDRPEPQHDPPRQTVADARAEQQQRDQGPHDEAERLGGEHHPDELPAVPAVGVLTHQHRADGVVTTDAEAQHEAEDDQHPEGRGQRRAQRTDDHDRRDQPVHPLTAEEVGDPAEHERAQEGRGQHGAVQQGQLAGIQVPLLLDQCGGDPDDEQVVGIGEEPHAGDQHRPEMKSADRRLIQGIRQALGSGFRHQRPLCACGWPLTGLPP